MTLKKYQNPNGGLNAAGNKKKIDGDDFKKLRNSTTAKKVMKKKKTRMA